MFAVYGLSGPIFRGTFERLGEVAAVTRSRPVQPVAGEEPRAATGTPSAQAISAYRQMLRVDGDRGPLYHAYQVMQRPVVSLFSEDTVERAWRLLLARRIHQAPVLDAGYRLVGIVSERDLLTTLNLDTDGPRDIMARQVGDVMTTPVVSADPVTDIRRIAQVMLEHAVDGVPIVNDRDALVGFVSRGDVLRAVITDPPLSLWR